MMEKKPKPAICIVDGVARSGTTFLGAVLNSLPNAHFFTDTFNLPKYYQDMHGCFDYPFSLSEHRRGNIDFGKSIPSYESFESECLNEALSFLKNESAEEKIRARFREECSRENTLSYIRIFEIFYEVVAQEFGVSLVGGKTTFSHAYKAQMLINIPHLKWIDIVRDVRGVFSSGMAAGMYNLNSLVLHEPWREQVKSISDFAKIVPPHLGKRHLTVHYKDLILKKKDTILKIINFLEIKNFNYEEWEKQPILKNNGEDFGSHSSFDLSGKPRYSIDFMDEKIPAFDQKPIKRWKEYLTGSQKWLLTALYKKELRFLGLDAKNSWSPWNPGIIWVYIKVCLGRMMRFTFKVIKKYF